MDNLIPFLGRTHPLIVHFPIVLILVGFSFELLARKKKYASFQDAATLLLWMGAISSTMAGITGYILSQEGGYQDVTLSFHKWFGIFVGVISWVLLFLKLIIKKNTEGIFNKTYIISYAILATILVVTGHLGASLTHGEAFLTYYAPWNDAMKSEQFVIPRIDSIQEAVVFSDIITPIFEQRCYACHSAQKQKGELRLDGQNYILQGGEHQSILKPGLADSSILYKRLMLPPQDDEHMPPNERAQPSALEIAFIQLWIDEGADFNMKVKDMAGIDKVEQYWQLWKEQAQKTQWIPGEDISQVDPNLIAQFEAMGILVIPYAEEVGYVHISFIQLDSVNNRIFEQISSIREHVISLEMKNIDFEREDLSIISTFSALRKLDLGGCKLKREDFNLLSKLNRLIELNLVGARFDHTNLAMLRNLKSLDRLYLFNTSYDREIIADLQELIPNLNIDTGGYVLPPLPTDTLVYQ